MKTMHAKYPGYCAQTGARIMPGDTIDYHGRGRSILRSRASADSSAGAGALKFVSDHIVIGGQSYYRNARGRCEDAPCCGCCTI